MDASAQTAPRPAAGKRGWRFYLRRLAIDLAAGYVLICAGIFFFQNRLVYQGTREASMNPQDYGLSPAQACEIETQSGDGVRLRGWRLWAPRKGRGADFSLSKAACVEIFFCGNAGNRGDRSGAFLRAVSLGADAVCFDYRGCGNSDGSPGEEGLAQDARAAWDWVRGQGVPAQSILLHGESLGGAVAVRLASELCAENTPPAGLILEASFPRLSAVAGLHYPFLPVRLLLTQRFPSVERIPAVTCPLLQFHGARDTLIPIALGEELHAAAPAQSALGMPKRFVTLPNCGHNDIGVCGALEYRAELKAFYAALFPELAKNGEPVTVEKRTPPVRRHRERTAPKEK